MRLRLKPALVVAVLAAGTPPPPATATRRYHRRAVAAVRSIAITSPDITLSAKQRELLTEALEEHLLLPRFDTISLPARIQQELDARIVGGVLNADDIQKILDAVAVPTLVQIMEATLYDRTGLDRPDYDRRSFINRKAKELDITPADLERMMQCGYLYVPFLKKVSIVDQGESSKVRLEGGLHWFHLSLVGEAGPHVAHVGVVEASATAGPKTWTSSLEKKFQPISRFFRKDKTHPAQAEEVALAPAQAAFRNASRQLGLNLSVKTRNHKNLRDVFCLSAPLVAIDGSAVSLALGSKEGLTIDDRYEVFEEYEDAEGNLYREKVGHFMIREVADNRDDPGTKSVGRAVIGSADMDLGQEAQEIARMGIDLSIRPTYHPLEVRALPEGSGFSLRGPSSQGAYGLDLALEMNVGRRLGWSQLFLTIGAAYGYAPLDAAFTDGAADSADVGRGHLFGYHFGLMRRAYLGRTALRVDVDYGGYALSLSHKLRDTNWKLSHSFSALRASGGIELALTATANLGLFGGYQRALGDGEWKLEIADASRILRPPVDGEGASHDGLYGGAVFTYALPSLGWNPF